MIFSIDFTHEGMTAAFVSPDGVAEDAAGFDLADFLAGESNPLDKLVTLVSLKARAFGGRVKAAVLAMPCALDRGREHVAGFHAASWLNEQPLPAILSEMLGVPVVMERRPIISLHYDRMMLGLPDDCVAVGCYIDTHFSSAIWDAGRFVSGRNGMAGDIAHMPVAGREDTCFCGKAGCVDLYGAGARMRQLHSMIFPDTEIDELFER
jgi:allose kinase